MMIADEYRNALETLGPTHADAGRFLHDGRTSRR
jgi:hypothetical protein